MYPSPPNAMSGDHYALWFLVNQPAGVRVCQTQGKSFIRRAKAKLRQVWGANARDVPDNGIWDYAFQLAIASVLSHGGTDLVALSHQLEHDASLGIITEQSVRVALWLAYLQGTDNPPESIYLSPNTILPRWGLEPADDAGFVEPGYGAVCSDQNTLDLSDTSTPTPSTPSTPIISPPVSLPMPVPGGDSSSGLPTWGKVGIAVGIAAVAIYVIERYTPPAKHR